ncbi:bifunctional folylpolyglutamate synthase/dihydrofolate synthase [Geitlerinema calcuttense]|uniref:tetrahydrofolate synthase n=1 Tax=Geitlerinema calcuttense NRMC-F 0142 TaxID=2922238 RepID=A0ABT7LZ49_9CYAN|nr:folylpolyglutamate synthase/dihydrofolate synthase family protein [Geitlerinema calcuttense]MDL5057294.1 folylpolyglutamate synthase/dihydrofolate synthase family protein [Geitlerinema calcuttense NRMC-F 0142]
MQQHSEWEIDEILKPFQPFGVKLGLERVRQLLTDLGNPQQQVPIVHVAGTNGKGSVCAYLSSVLTAAGYRTGRYTSPHLIDWTERICINGIPISTADFKALLWHVRETVEAKDYSPTLFEVVTAAAWLYFAQQQVDIAVIEVGLGGRLDATNVCEKPLVSIITSISREHWQILGPTLADIAREKAGILKPECSAVVGVLPPEAQAVVAARIQELNCPAIFVPPALDLGSGQAQFMPPPGLTEMTYPVSLLGEMQLQNSALAIATLQLLQQQGWHIPDTTIQQGMAQTQWAGRLQWYSWQNTRILIDGAHNPAAAQVLRQYIETLGYAETQITWVMGMLSTKDHRDIFQALLKPGNQLNLVPVPNHDCAEPQQLAKLAQEVTSELALCQVHPDVETALTAAVADPQHLVILCGSLYLIGDFLKQDSQPPD